MIVQWPGKIAAGQVSDDIISSVDYHPTFAELAGTELPANQVIDGLSFVNILAGGEQDKDRVAFWHYPVYHHDSPASAIRKGDWKLIHYLHNDKRLLFNLSDDIGESTDLHEQNPEKTEELYRLLEEWRIDAGAEFPVPNPDFDPEQRYQWVPHPDSKRRGTPPIPK